MTQLWRTTLEALDSDGIPAQQRAFLSLTRPVGLLDGTALLAAPNDFTKEIVEPRMRDRSPPPWAPARSRGAARRHRRPLPGRGPGARPRGRPRPERAERRGARPARRRPPPPDRRPRHRRGRGRRHRDLRLRRHPTRARRGGCRPWQRARRHPGPGRGTRGPPSPPEQPAARAGRADPAQPEVHLRHLRHRRQQPVRPRGRGRGRRGAGQGLQPAVRLRRVRAGQDAPAARHRALRPQPLPGRPGALRELRGVHQRLHQQHPRRQGGRLPAPLPRRRRAAHRRHPVPAGQGADAGGVLPHLQHPAQRQQAGRHHLGPAAQAAQRLRGADAHPVRVGPDSPTSSRPTSRPGSRSCARRPSASGCRCPTTCWSTSPARSPPTSASSRAR